MEKTLEQIELELKENEEAREVLWNLKDEIRLKEDIKISSEKFNGKYFAFRDGNLMVFSYCIEATSGSTGILDLFEYGVDRGSFLHAVEHNLNVCDIEIRKEQFFEELGKFKSLALSVGEFK